MKSIQMADEKIIEGTGGGGKVDLLCKRRPILIYIPYFLMNQLFLNANRGTL